MQSFLFNQVKFSAREIQRFSRTPSSFSLVQHPQPGIVSVLGRLFSPLPGIRHDEEDSSTLSRHHLEKAISPGIDGRAAGGTNGVDVFFGAEAAAAVEDKAGGGLGLRFFS